MEEKRTRWSSTKTNVLVDIAIFVAFLLALDPRSTGIAIHEWLSIALSAAIVIHLLLHWQWMVQVTRRFYRRTSGKARLNYVVDALFFVSTTTAIVSGLLISEAALPALGIPVGIGGIWRLLHSLAANLSLLALALHVALHGAWIVDVVKRYVIRPLGRIGSLKPQPTAAPEVKP
jgi:hypothetical protein